MHLIAAPDSSQQHKMGWAQQTCSQHQNCALSNFLLWQGVCAIQAKWQHTKWSSMRCLAAPCIKHCHDSTPQRYTAAGQLYWLER